MNSPKFSFKKRRMMENLRSPRYRSQSPAAATISHEIPPLLTFLSTNHPRNRIHPFITDNNKLPILVLMKNLKIIKIYLLKLELNENVQFPVIMRLSLNDDNEIIKIRPRLDPGLPEQSTYQTTHQEVQISISEFSHLMEIVELVEYYQLSICSYLKDRMIFTKNEMDQICRL
jgi:hypothetical protein